MRSTATRERVLIRSAHPPSRTALMTLQARSRHRPKNRAEGKTIYLLRHHGRLIRTNLGKHGHSPPLTACLQFFSAVAHKKTLI
jgi:hypothetical protein